MVPLITQYADELPAAGVSYADFCEAASLVSSRAFHVDSDHGDAMVPLADIFNHRSAVLPLSDGLGIEGMEDSGDRDYLRETDDSVTGTAAQPELPNVTRPSRKRRRVAAPKAASSPGSSNNDEADDDDAMGVRDKLREAPLHAKYPLNIAICNQEQSKLEAGALEIVLMHPTAKGSEIWNTYGELSNGALLMKYGFATSDNPHNIVNVEADLAITVLEQFAEAGDYASWLLQIEEVFGDDGLFEFDLGGSAPDALVFLVWCVVGSERRFRRNAASAVIHAAQDADKAGMLADRPTRQCLICIVKARLELYGHRHPQGTLLPALLAKSRRLVQAERRGLARAQARSRSPNRTAAMVLRVCEQEILLAALEGLAVGLETSTD